MSDQREARYKAAADAILGGMSGHDYQEGLAQIKVLVDGWYDDAGTIDPEDLFRIGLSDLKDATADAKGARLLQTLNNLALERQVQALSGQVFHLAQHVADHSKTAASAQTEAASLSKEIDALLPRVHQLQDAALKQRCLRELADADLECRYIKEGDSGAMSVRLNQYIQR